MNQIIEEIHEKAAFDAEISHKEADIIFSFDRLRHRALENVDHP